MKSEINTNAIFNISSDNDFNELALSVFRMQYQNNEVYKSYVNHLSINPENVNDYTQIPFLPIAFFKTHRIISGDIPEGAIVFESSGTASQIKSRHFVKDTNLYKTSFLKGFELFYGDVKDYCILALLPGYTERANSSLVYMVNELIQLTEHNKSGFYLNNSGELISVINELKKQNQKTILIGVSYALLDLADEKIKLDDNFIVMETGGMKGKRKELVKEELHGVLKKAFAVKNIHSEYGMTELLSQAYSFQNGYFKSPPWMKILTRDIDDPFSLLKYNKTGGINVIDLANIYSCSFIATQDLGRLSQPDIFEVAGRFDNSDIRGCNLMMD